MPPDRSDRRKLADLAPVHCPVRTGKRSYVVLVEPDGETRRPFLPDASITAPHGLKKGSKRVTALAQPVGDADRVTMRVFVQAELAKPLSAVPLLA